MNGLGPLDLDTLPAPKKAGKIRDGRVCVCGHGAGAHGPTSREHFDVPLDELPKGMVGCSAGRHRCACEEFYPVLETSDVRRFMSKTIGPGADHALARGVATALAAGVSVRWNENIPCGRCHAEGERLLPVAVRVDERGARVALSTTPHNYLLCGTCRDSLTVEPDAATLAPTDGPVYGM